ncbi:MAG: pyruvate kinase [Acidimicrobiales bacterium]
MHRRTKIIATIGPASDDEAVMVDMIEAGMDVARLNLSHGTLDDSTARFNRVRSASATVGKHKWHPR